MSLHSPDFFFENFVPESRLEFALPHGRSRDIHGFLPTTKKDLRMILVILGETDDSLGPHRVFLVQ